MKATWDSIVVGAGSAGCALAGTLAQSGQRVLILEAGGSNRSPWIRFPGGVMRAIAENDWGHRSEPDPTRNGASENWLHGRVLGGGSSINGMLYARGSAGDFDRWSAQGGHAGNWSSQQVQAVYQKIEHSDQPGSTRGHLGPLCVRTVKHPHRMSQAFVQAAIASGYPFNPDYNSQSQEGVAYAQLSQRRGLRCSSADAFLRPSVRRDNVKLLLNATVQRIEVSNGSARAVSFVRKGQSFTEPARQIILCAGAIGSPHVLMLSGIGDKEELIRHGLPVVLDLPGVGRNLIEHPLLRLTYRAKISTFNLTEGILQKLKFCAQFLRYGEGPIANVFESVAFLKSTSSESRPDIQLHFVPFGYVAQPSGSIEIAPFPSVTVLLNKSHPLSRGRVRLASSNPTEAPRIEARLLDHEADIETLVRGTRVVRTIMNTEPMAGLIEAEVAPGVGLTSDAQIQEYIRASTTIAAHPVGTCRMGTGPEAVVGPDLRVRGIENLWLADASIMPEITSGNTNAASIMIGAKLGMQLVSREL